MVERKVIWSVLAVFWIVILSISLAHGLSFFDDSQVDFDLGAYNSTAFNGSGVVLSAGATSGTYTSRIFDAGVPQWNNIGWVSSIPLDYNSTMWLALHTGSNRTQVFNKDDIYYDADMKESSKRFYLNFSSPLINNSVVKFYAKYNKGVTIGIYAQSDSAGSNMLGSFTVSILNLLGGWHDVALNLNTPTKAIWIGEGTGSGIDPRDEFDYIYAEVPISSNLSFQVRNCSSENCADGTFAGPDGTASSFYTNSPVLVNMTGRYFQYKSFFSTTSYTATLESFSLGYNVINTAPAISISSPVEAYLYNRNHSLSLNFSVTDSNLQACWYKLNDGANISLPNCANSTFNASQGSSILVLYANDSEGLISSSAVSFSTDSILPLVSISYPTNSSYSFSSFSLNYSVFDSNLQNCKYSVDSGATNTTITCGSNVTGLTASQGSNTWRVYVNDSHGNFNYTELTFFVDSIPPSLIISSPAEGSTFGSSSIPLKYIVSDTNLQACWYHLDGNSNVTLPNCANTTINVIGGSHQLYLYVNDSVGDKTYAYTTFTVNLGAPTISLISPAIASYLNYSNVSFVYNASEDPAQDLQACELWGDFDGSFSQKLVNNSLISGQLNSFSLNLSDRQYKWNVGCNDSQGNFAFGGNRSFSVDTLAPSITLTEPSGTKNSRTDISLLFNIIEVNADACWYEVVRGSTIEIAERKISCSSGSSIFNVTLDADFVLRFYANDSAGNFNSASKSFRVSTAVGGGSGGSGSSGGSSGGSSFGSVASEVLRIEASDLGDIVLRPGEARTLELTIRNTGTRFLNRCSLKAPEGISFSIRSDDAKNINPGEISSFVFTLDSRDSLQSPGEIILSCFEREFSIPIKLILLNPNIQIALESISQESPRELLIRYTAASELNDRETIIFFIYGSGNELLSQTSQEISPVNGKASGEAIVKLPRGTRGMLKVSVKDRSSDESIIEESFLYNGGGVTGLAIFDDLRSQSFYTVSFVIIFIGLTIYISRRIFNLHKELLIQNSVKVKSP